MNKLLLIFVILSLACNTNNTKTVKMGIFDKLFGKSEQKPVINESVQNSDKLMAADKFWGIIEMSKKNSSGDYEKQQEELGKQLSKLSALDILEFDNKFRTLRGEAYTWDFWAAAYIINGGCSDDCFSDFRAWLIGQGKEIFENAKENIESLVDLKETNDGDWEGLSYIPTEAYENKTGKDIPTGIRENFEIKGKEWSEEGDELKSRFPKLWAKYGTE